jgi:hypothetical protein
VLDRRARSSLAATPLAVKAPPGSETKLARKPRSGRNSWTQAARARSHGGNAALDRAGVGDGDRAILGR